MTKREIGILACRILAIYAWLQALHYLPAFFGLADPLLDEVAWSNYEIFIQVTGALPAFLLVTAGWFLWRWAGLIAAWMLGHDLHDHQFEPEDAPQRVRADDFHVIAFSSLGLWILLDSIPHAISYATQVIYTRSISELADGHKIITMTASIDIFVRLILGFWLLFGARAWVRLVKKARTAE